MASFHALIMGLASLILSLLILTQPSEQQYAWRPQGRFGKRANYISDGLLRDRGVKNPSSRIKMLDTSMFESEGVLCVSATSRGLYRCFSVSPDSGSSAPVTQLDTPYIEADGILCVSVGDVGTYRCFELDDNEIAEQSLNKH